MRVAATGIDRQARVTKALLKLSSARREKLSDIDFEVYVDGLAQFDVRSIECVCADLGEIAPEEYQPRFPPLHSIRERCFKRAEIESERERMKRPALGAYVEPPVNPERWAEFKAAVAQRVQKMRMR